MAVEVGFEENREIQMVLETRMREEVRELTMDTVELLKETNKIEKEEERERAERRGLEEIVPGRRYLCEKAVSWEIATGPLLPPQLR